MKQKRNCDEHELFIEDEYWISDDKLKTTLKCSLCNTKFSGELKRNGI